MTITEIGFERAPMGSSSAVLSNFRLNLGTAGGEEPGGEFAGNVSDDGLLRLVFSGSSVTAADGGDGRVMFSLDPPYEYTGGHLLLDFSYTDIQGSMYVWSWDAGGKRMVSAYGSAETGSVTPFPPVVVIRGN